MTTTSDLRARRERLGITRLQLAIQAGISMAWLASLEGGMRPEGSNALAKVRATLAELEREAK